MPFFKRIPAWAEVGTLYTAAKLDTLCTFLEENQIPYKLCLGTALPQGAASPQWRLFVRPADAGRVAHYAATEHDF